jgi:hypothetical protein
MGPSPQVRGTDWLTCGFSGAGTGFWVLSLISANRAYRICPH